MKKNGILVKIRVEFESYLNLTHTVVSLRLLKADCLVGIEHISVNPASTKTEQETPATELHTFSCTNHLTSHKRGSLPRCPDKETKVQQGSASPGPGFEPRST